MVVKRRSVSRKKRTNSKRKVVSKKRTNSKRKVVSKKRTNSKRKVVSKKRTNSKRKVVSKKKTNSKKKIKGGHYTAFRHPPKGEEKNYSFFIPNSPSLIPVDEIRTKLLEEYKNIKIDQKKYEYTKGLIIGPYVNLSGADLYGIKLTGKDLTGADLSNTDLSRAKLSRAKLTNADLTQADLTNAELYWVKSGGIKGEPKFLPKGKDSSGVRLEYKIVNGYLVGTMVNLNYANLTGADLTNAYLFDADLINADLRGAILKSAELRHADLRSAILTGADLTRADLTGANLSKANLSNAVLTNTDLTDVNLTGTILSSIETLPNMESKTLFKASIDYLYKQFKIGDSFYNLKTIHSEEKKYYASYFPKNNNRIKMKKTDFVKLNIEVFDKVNISNSFYFKYKYNRMLPICNKKFGNCKSEDNDPGSTKSMISRKKGDLNVNLSKFFPKDKIVYFHIKDLKDNQNLEKDGFTYYLSIIFTKDLFQQTYIELVSIVAIKEEPRVNS